jgi:hypothetical protein
MQNLENFMQIPKTNFKLEVLGICGLPLAFLNV